MGKGGGSAPAQPTTQTVQQSNIPEYARPYFEDIMSRGQAVSQAEYQPYTGERVAPFTPMQQQAFEGIQNLGVSPLIGAGAGMTGAAGIGGLTAGQSYTQQATSPGSMQAYMSPYMQNVVDFQKTQAIQDYARQLPGMQAGATNAGAFGGSRQAIVESEAQRNLQNQLAGIQAQGTQSAFDAARQAQQFGSQLGLQGLGLAGQMGQQFGQLGQQAFGQQAAALQAQQQAGAIQQAQAQQQRDLAYEEFMRQQLYPQSQLQFLSSLLRGSVVAPQQTMYTYQQQPSMVSQLGGLGIGALGLSKAFGAKDGGEVPGYAEGGVTGGDPKAQGVTPSRVTNVKKQLLAGVDPRKVPDPLGVMLALQDRDFVKQLELTSAAKNQQALDGGRQQAPSVYDEKMSEAGLAGMDAGVMEDVYAGGGIVAFSNGAGPAGVDINALAGELDEARARLKMMRPPGTASTQRDPTAMDAYRQAQQRVRDLETRWASTVESQVPAAGMGGLGALGRAVPQRLPLDVPSPAGLPAALPQQSRVSSAEGEPEPTTYAQQKPSPQPKPQPRPEAPPARAAATAAPAIKPEEPRTSLLYTGEKPEEAFARKEKEMESRFPSELKERLEELKTQGQQAVKDRDADRWLAVAMGGFAAAAGQSPYALQNFAQGLGLTTKEIAAVNKDFRKAEDLRNKAMREETKIDRLERMQKFDAADKARTRVEDITRQAQKADAMYQVELKKIAEKRFETETRQRIAGMQAQDSRETRKLTRDMASMDRIAIARAQSVDRVSKMLLEGNPTAFNDPDKMSAIIKQAEQIVDRQNPQFARVNVVSAIDAELARRSGAR